MGADSQNMPDIGAMLNGLMSNPGALSMLSSLLGQMGKPSTPPPCGCSNEPPPCDPCPKAPPILPPVPPPKPKDNRACLLEAMRPFLSPDRCEMIDTLVHILALLELFRHRR